MSLSRILNDDPVPRGHTPYVGPSHSTTADAPRSPSVPLASTAYSYSSQHRSRDPQFSRTYNHPVGTLHHAPSHQDSGDWTREGNYRRSAESHSLSGKEYEYDRGLSDVARHFRGQGEDPEDTMRKRYKGANEDSDYRLSGQRKMSQHTRRDERPRPGSPLSDTPGGELVQRPDEEERRLASSDLDDCEEVWIGELSDYILETKKRQNQVAQYFWASVLERNSATAQDMSRHYAAKIANIPLPHPLSPHNLVRPLNEEAINAPSVLYGSATRHSARRERRNSNASAEDAVNEFERYLFGDSRKGKGTETRKRAVPDVPSYSGSDLESPRQEGSALPPIKKRKLDNGAAHFAEGVERPVGVDIFSAPPVKPPISLKGKGKGKQAQRELSHDSVSVTPKLPRKKPGPKKKLGLELESDTVPHPPSILSILGEITPTLSRPTSPGPASIAVIYELEEYVPPLKKAKKIDDNAMIKRIKSLDDAQRKVWTNIARRDVAKVYKYHALGYQTRQSQLERMAKLASIQARKPFTKTAKANKDTQAKAKRLMREMQVFWKKNEKEERDVRKREQKEAMDRLKLEEEKREAARQARKLEFLISQTELYSHFVGSKLKTSDIEGEESLPVPVGAHFEDDNSAILPEINFDDDDPTNLHRHARFNAQEAVALAKQRAQQFDTQAALERKTNEALKLAKAQSHIHEETEGSNSKTPLVDLDSDELNFQNPTSLSGPLTIEQPKILMAQLKEYQLKGLNWLATLYEQGINGILADEMGLGKTVQSISLLAYLAEEHDIWGPFLVVAPASTLHNWQQELTRFVPHLKALPYWGNVKDRTTLRKFWSKKEISYNQDAPFHVLITSYQLVTQDQQYFQRVKWQYMILDEAQNIKNSASVRWKTLLGFQCRNRLLLTGTPIQNSMQELWALLHFIMPSLFDSHDEFNEWFSKDIENAAENKGSKLNEHQLRRLHMILKPFMLRRVKKHVQNELSEKIEKDIYVDLSPRQRALYTALVSKVSVSDLLEKAANIGDVDSARSLMNLVMQFRKVCNHPELFERADVVAPYSFSRFGQSRSLMREGDSLFLPYSTRNPIEFSIPQLLYQDGGLIDVPSDALAPVTSMSCLTELFNIWSTDWIHQSLYDEVASSFSFLRLIDVTPQDAHFLHVAPLLQRRLHGVGEEIRSSEASRYTFDAISPAYSLRMSSPLSLPGLSMAVGLPDLSSIATTNWTSCCLSRPAMKWFIPPVVAPPISIHCVDRTLVESQTRFFEAPLESLALYGLPRHLQDSDDCCRMYHNLIPAVPPAGLINSSPSDQLPRSNMVVPEAKRLIYDSAKLARLDSLLQELKAGDHRVLIYFQMTRMMDLMEEYLIYRQYKYLRLDGSSKLEDRRDMVIDWQTRPDIFVFLLSTRAGGLGINLTAADTVVFYDHDWNPSNDAQAMDRAHRLGQTRQVTVYRLITKGTIDERIIQLARVKKDVQDIVVGNKNFTDVTKPSEIVQLLLNDEQLASFDSAAGLASNTKGKQAGETRDPDSVRDLWNDEGDDFFGHAASLATKADEENGPSAAAPSVRGKKRKSTTTGAPRGRPKKKGGP